MAERRSLRHVTGSIPYLIGFHLRRSTRATGGRGAGATFGQSTVEFAMASVVFLLIVFGTVDFGRAVFLSAELHNAVREGSAVGRLSVPHNTVKSTVVDHARSNGLTTGAVAVSCTGGCKTGDVLTVEASASFSAITQSFLGIPPLTLRASSTVDIE